MFFPLDSDKIIHRTLVSNPKCSWFLGSGQIHYNRMVSVDQKLGLNKVNFYNLEYSGRAESLDEMNVDRDAIGHSPTNQKLIYPFIYKKNGNSLQGLTEEEYYGTNNGGVINGSYPLLTQLETHRVPLMPPPPGVNYYLYIDALENIINQYKILNPLFDFSLVRLLGVRIINIPEIFYGSKINPGSVKLNYFAGIQPGQEDLIGTATDKNGDGVLYQDSSWSGFDDGAAIGLVLYYHGIIILFSPVGSPPLSLDPTHQGFYYADIQPPFWPLSPPRWACWGVAGAFNGARFGSYELFLEGHHEINNVTYLLECKNLNFSNNPTFLSGSRAQHLDDKTFREDISTAEVYNTAPTVYETDDNYQARVFISKIGLYDENRNLIGIASLSQPATMYAGREMLFKLSFDI